ncbi:MAG TPA: aminotransferase class V-fold PLP-dependent enzyme, partial [Fimbriimonadaceae bacterium]|nr:aminotransferase class V-fold PLP-dependent enzyme [Fimbriimonadaceae bacterium]
MSALLTSNLDVDAIRADFPALHQDVHGAPLVYLDNAATSQKPRQVLDAVQRFFEDDNANVHRGVHTLSQRATSRYDAVRGKVQTLLNAAEADEIIFTKGCTEGINLVSTGLGRLTRGLSSTKSVAGETPALPVMGPGDEILVTTMEHHSNIVPWQMLAAETGAVVRAIPVSDSGEVLLDAYRSMLSPKTRLVGIVHVSNSLGTINPVKEMARLAHEVGALVLIDGAQAGPHLAVDVQDIDADFYTLSCHKIYAPTGVGVLYGKRRLLEALPPYQGGGDMIRSVSFEETTYAPIPAKFEAGTPNIAGVIGLGAAIDYLASLDCPSP